MVSDDRKLYGGPNLSHEQDCRHYLGGATLSRSYELDQKFYPRVISEFQDHFLYLFRARQTLHFGCLPVNGSLR